MTGWVQIIIGTDADQAEPLSELLESLGAASVTFTDAADQPMYEPPLGTTPLWQATNVIGLFTADTDMSELIKQLEHALHPRALPHWKVQHLENKNWEKEWMKNFHPIRFGQRLWICPSWQQTPEPNAVNVLLDPGLAFGTGTHPTTALCLQWLDANIRGSETIIDYGCGSGILAIAALKLGAQKACAIDHDPQALLSCELNAEKNGVRDQLHIGQMHADCLPADIVLANILANPLLELAQTLADLVKPGGRIILSGILQEQAKTIADCYQAWFDIAEIQEQDDWIRVVGTKRSEH